MAVPKFVFLLFFVAPHSVTSKIIIGAGVEMRRHNVIGDVLQQSGAQLYANLPASCVYRIPAYQTLNTFAYYEDTQTFYRKIGTTAGVSAKLQSDYTLGFTLDSATSSISGTARTVKGNTLEIQATTSQEYLKKSCFYNENLHPRLLEDLRDLPNTINEPWKSSSWEKYHVFLTKYGSHVVTGEVFGSSIHQTSFSESHLAYSQNDFQIKSCMSLMGPTEAGVANISLCAGVTQEEINTVSTYYMSGSLVINGGKYETRNKLLYERSSELIEQFMNEASETHSPIYYKYSPIWELVQGHANSSNDDFIKAVNMEQYYHGYLSYGCSLIQAAGLDLRKFEVSPHASPSTPRYQCTLEAEGCHNDDSCHYRWVKCQCRLGQCVRHEPEILDTGVIKHVPGIHQAVAWYWQGCDWKVAGSVCKCKSPNPVRFVAWSGDNKGFLSPGGNRSTGAKIKSFEDKEEL